MTLPGAGETAATETAVETVTEVTPPETVTQTVVTETKSLEGESWEKVQSQLEAITAKLSKIEANYLALTVPPAPEPMPENTPNEAPELVIETPPAPTMPTSKHRRKRRLGLRRKAI